MKKTLFLIFSIFVAASVFAQSDDDLFGGNDDDLFSDSGIVENTEPVSKASSDLAHGVLFENGSIKISGRYDMSLGTQTTLWQDQENTADSEKKTFKDYVYETTLTPAASALLSVDARPSENLRLYTKFGIGYPYVNKASTQVISQALTKVNTQLIPSQTGLPTALSLAQTNVYNSAVTSIQSFFSVKELFTDFSLFDAAFFRFGLHTVSWGTGYFFSPVSDMINTSSINPENTSEDVSGSLNLRTQITFPGTQNCLWFYVVPSTDFITNTTADSYARDTALAAKGEFLLGDWEVGVGGYWKYENSPKLMATLTGGIFNINFFGEFVYQYGSANEWSKNKEWKDKTNIIKATAGAMYYWKKPKITVAAQYYYDGNSDDETSKYFTYGHNVALLLSFSELFGSEDFSASIFGLANFGKEELSSEMKTYLASYGVSSALFNSVTASATLSYSPVSEMTFGIGPYVTMQKLDSKPDVSLKLSFTLGGGKF